MKLRKLETQKNKRLKKSILVVLLVLVIIFIDQALKYWVKTTFAYHGEIMLFDNWGRLHFLENDGMAFGKKISDIPLIGQYIKPEIGKFLLTIFRLIASVFIVLFIKKLITKRESGGLIISMALILAGAVGNIIDSIFYGKLFSYSDPFTHNVAEFMPEDGGYAGWFQGRVVDMFYFPMVDTNLPEWIPFFGGDNIQFFQPVFNVADSAISVGIFLILLFHRGYFLKK